MFDEEGVRLQRIFGGQVLAFEHFGSIAVPGIPAKPVIVMICIVKNMEQIDEFSGQMAALGYDVAGEWGIPGRRLFSKGGEERSHHIHVYQIGNPHIQRHLVVRDYLRAHPQ